MVDRETCQLRVGRSFIVAVEFSCVIARTNTDATRAQAESRRMKQFVKQGLARVGRESIEVVTGRICERATKPKISRYATESSIFMQLLESPLGGPQCSEGAARSRMSLPVTRISISPRGGLPCAALNWRDPRPSRESAAAELVFKYFRRL